MYLYSVDTVWLIQTVFVQMLQTWDTLTFNYTYSILKRRDLESMSCSLYTHGVWICEFNLQYHKSCVCLPSIKTTLICCRMCTEFYTYIFLIWKAIPWGILMKYYSGWGIHQTCPFFSYYATCLHYLEEFLLLSRPSSK